MELLKTYEGFLGLKSIKSLFKKAEFKQPDRYIPDTNRLYAIMREGVLDIRESGMEVDIKVDHHVNQVIASIDICRYKLNPDDYDVHNPMLGSFKEVFNFYDINDDIISLLGYIRSEYRTNSIKLSYTSESSAKVPSLVRFASLTSDKYIVGISITNLDFKDLDSTKDFKCLGIRIAISIPIIH